MQLLLALGTCRCSVQTLEVACRKSHMARQCGSRLASAGSHLSLLYFAFCCCHGHHDQKQFVEDRVYFVLPFGSDSITEGSQGTNLRQEPGAKMKGCLLPCCLAQSSDFLLVLRKGACIVTLMINTVANLAAPSLLFILPFSFRFILCLVFCPHRKLCTVCV